MQQLAKKQNDVKAAIPYGGLSEIAERSGTSIYTVSRVVNGKSRNRKVLTEISAYLTELNTVNESINSNALALLQ
jgi:transcriptional regulator with XRE-family HTH domain